MPNLLSIRKIIRNDKVLSILESQLKRGDELLVDPLFSKGRLTPLTHEHYDTYVKSKNGNPPRHLVVVSRGRTPTGRINEYKINGWLWFNQ